MKFEVIIYTPESSNYSIDEYGNYYLFLDKTWRLKGGNRIW